MNRDGEQLRKEHKLIPLLDEHARDTGHEVLASDQHAGDLRTLEFLAKEYTADTVPHLVDIVRAKFGQAFEAAIQAKPGLEVEREARRKRRNARRRRNRIAQQNGEAIEPDTDNEAVTKDEAAKYGRTLAFFANKTSEHYQAPHIDDVPIVEELTEGEETDGEALLDPPTSTGKKRTRL